MFRASKHIFFLRVTYWLTANFEFLYYIILNHIYITLFAGNIVLVTVLLVFMFAVIGVQLFKVSSCAINFDVYSTIFFILIPEITLGKTKR